MKKHFYPLTFKHIVFGLAMLFWSQLALAQFTVSGTLETPLGVPMSGYYVELSGSENKLAITDGNGHYSFSSLAAGDYEIRPLSCEVNPVNGVSTYDLVLIYRHLEGIEPLNSPYSIIAGDIDGSNSLTLQDTSMMWDLILGIINDIPLPGANNRFVLKDYVFPDPMDPFTPAYPQTFNIANLQADVLNADFIGIKMGDVNNTALLGQCDQSDFFVTGKVYHDQNNNCQFTPGEPGLGGWNISMSDGNNTFYGTSNGGGNYKIAALPGTYDIVLSNPAGLWGACSDTLYGVDVAAPGSSGNNFGLQPETLCASMQVDLSTPILRRCFNNYYTVQYCNTGTEMAENARIEVQFDPFFLIVSSTHPWSEVNGNTYTFELGDVPSGACNDFKVVFILSCDAVLGQSHCSEAQIFPDTICAPNLVWNGAALRVLGFCAGNEVKFVIANEGTDMSVPSNYIVVEDIVVMTPPVNNPFTLLGGTSQIITLPANGATWRLEAEQPAGYPWGDVASATVEGCGTNANGTFSLGFVNQFPQDDQSPVLDIDCQENVGSYDPNDKQGFPLGVLDEHYIPLEQPIEYLIRFQNTGTDTAFTVVIRDTLDAGFDLNSIRPLGSSHPYTFSLLGQNVARFEFANILLPDSNVNEAASHGYVKFSIEPKRETINGTVVQNQAAIYFDFNAPIITNRTWHTLGEQYLNVSNAVFSPGIELEVFPNPVAEVATFLIKSERPVRGTLTVFDLQGRAVHFQDFDQNQFDFQCGNLTAGCYIFKLNSEGRALAAGKLVVMKN